MPRLSRWKGLIGSLVERLQFCFFDEVGVSTAGELPSD